MCMCVCARVCGAVWCMNLRVRRYVCVYLDACLCMSLRVCEYERECVCKYV
jgi:hypothetical protein